MKATNIELLDLRHRALAFAGKDARRIVDQVFGILLQRAIDGDPDLRVLVRTNDPSGYEPSSADDDRICIRHRPSKRSASVAQRRLRRCYVISAYKAMVDVLPFVRPGSPVTRLSDPGQLDSLVRDSRCLIGDADFTEVFEPENGAPKSTRQTMNGLSAELVRY